MFTNTQLIHAHTQDYTKLSLFTPHIAFTHVTQYKHVRKLTHILILSLPSSTQISLSLTHTHTLRGCTCYSHILLEHTGTPTHSRTLTAGQGWREGPSWHRSKNQLSHSILSDAFLEGYVQQFLYTFRYFCTPHDFLHFLLDRISSTLSRYHHMGSWLTGVGPISL